MQSAQLKSLDIKIVYGGDCELKLPRKASLLMSQNFNCLIANVRHLSDKMIREILRCATA